MIKTCPCGWNELFRAADGFSATYEREEPLVKEPGRFKMIVSWGGGWDHVSVSSEHRCPTWDEMEKIARHFWPDEVAIQYHVPTGDHINNHPFCLHWWRPQNRGVRIPTPPKEYV